MFKITLFFNTYDVGRVSTYSHTLKIFATEWGQIHERRFNEE